MDNTANWISALSAAIAALGTLLAAAAAIYGVHVARHQLQDLKNTLKLNGLSAILTIESELSERGFRCIETDNQLKRHTRNANADPFEKELLQSNRNAALEGWLNSLDRLCFCIRREYVPEKDWRAEYRDYLRDAIREHPEFFKADTPYTNILKLHEQWRE